MNLIKRNTDNWLPSIFDDMFKTDWMDNGNNGMSRIGTSVPAVNIAENDESFTLEVAAPGMSKKDFNLELDNGVLTISSEVKKEDEKKENGGRFTRREFSYTSFKRAFSLPETVDPEKISAKYNEGVLKIELPKREDAKVQAKRMIDIK
ncbi:MAG: Hsp20/alpha crystallin family protein [Salinimicrobium sediminis]|uniref:Heat shock protein Hsp20 n=1 Tax=Salinimicrobium sediminis TaxID=1343891 RepID=A0A285X972_9FLAO|nr:Hsp20/alpha crystallin family protein [Salinimicrobium sediminis]MDX1602250.1 Hsp20/alpha crystallin family protein [Salinimicrobium sediminis]MDX1752521.1 Hsp20/alpha crystallin family protein [Salinimicrobium sediminis]SOC81334.1 heat shock protein Hsp20 [Salinimicrobium sediminis]